MTWQSLAVVTAYERVNAVGLTSILDLGLFFWFRLASLTDAWSVHDSRVSFIHFISFCPKPLHSQQSLTVTIITLSWTVRLGYKAPTSRCLYLVVTERMNGNTVDRLFTALTLLTFCSGTSGLRYPNGGPVSKFTCQYYGTYDRRHTIWNFCHFRFQCRIAREVQCSEALGLFYRARYVVAILFESACQRSAKTTKYWTTQTTPRNYSTGTPVSDAKPLNEV